jgi:hypothetical protein
MDYGNLGISAKWLVRISWIFFIILKSAEGFGKEHPYTFLNVTVAQFCLVTSEITVQKYLVDFKVSGNTPRSFKNL